MATSAISVEALGKRYRLGGRPTVYRTLREAIGELGHRSSQRDDLWALRDVSFEVEPGTAIGVVGANGAGKTTLLKILSRISAPTTGRARVRGRVGALLEVGTGFHPELTGRENVYLNGAILGMRRNEIARKFDEIVAFAEVERFIDTPVKRYSSGMYLRLAFAVAAHLDCDILLVDEALSVGDYGFQQRCLGKMQEQTSSEGRTVLFVSHNLGAISALTERCIWLDKGQVKAYGATSDVFRAYVLSYRDAAQGGALELGDGKTGRPQKELPQEILFESIEIHGRDGRPSDTHLEREPMHVVIRVRANEPLRNTRLELLCRISTVQGVLVFTAIAAFDDLDLPRGVHETSFRVDPNPLAGGTYSIQLYALTMSGQSGDRAQDIVTGALTFHIQESTAFTDDLLVVRHRETGIVRVDFPWSELTPVGSVSVAERA